MDTDIIYDFEIDEVTLQDYKTSRTILEWIRENLSQLKDDNLKNIFNKVNLGYNENSLKGLGKKPVCDIYLSNIIYKDYLDYQVPDKYRTVIVVSLKGNANNTYAKGLELHDYMQSVLADSAAVILEFKGNRLEMFHISPPDSDRFSNFWDDDARAKCDSLMSVVGLTEEEYQGIRNRLKSIGCIGIKASRTSPETTEIWFRRDGIGLYSYILSTCPFNSDEKEEIMKNLSICPYNEHVLFEYAGAAFGSDNFPQRDEYLKKHQPW